MVEVRNPLQSEEASGSFGGQIVFKPRKTQQVACRKVNPSNPKTERQQIVRAALAAASRGWGTLSAINVALWEAYAQRHPRETMGAEYRSPGYNCYVRCSRAYFEFYGDAPPHPAPANDALDVSNVFVQTHGSTYVVNLGFTLPVPWVDGWLLEAFYQGPLKNANRALRDPEQKHGGWQNQVHPSITFQVPALGHYWVGVRCLPPGVVPRQIHWLRCQVV